MESTPGGTLPPAASERKKSLMESILAAKIEQATTNKRIFSRNDSADSASSMGSAASTTSNFCHCDDCLLGIADLYSETSSSARANAKKVCLDLSFVNTCYINNTGNYCNFLDQNYNNNLFFFFC